MAEVDIVVAEIVTSLEKHIVEDGIRGLGHGPEAELAVERTGNTFLENSATPVEQLRHINDASRKTRDLAGTVVTFANGERKWRHCGIGNIAARLNDGNGGRNYMPYKRIIGLNVPNTLNTQALLQKNQHELELYINKLNQSNEELQQFAFVASQDLQEQVHKMGFYSDLLFFRR